MTAPVDILGVRFGRLLVTGPADRRNGRRVTCACDCGVVRAYSVGDLRCGDTTSCGCLAIELARTRATKHGEGTHGNRSPEYVAWRGIIDRCGRVTSKNYPYYGGRGIAVCDRWRSFEAFLADMGRRPSPRHSMDRIDNDGNYEPGNCRWATRREQMNNTRSNRVITIAGVSRTLTEWCRAGNLKLGTALMRIDRLGWDVERAVTEPPIRR